MTELSKLFPVVIATVQLAVLLIVPVSQVVTADRTFEAGVVPGVLEDFHLKRVLNFSSTAHTVTLISWFLHLLRESVVDIQVPFLFFH